MTGLFTNPVSLVLGVLLISSPIIIHLINRLRFKRVRWAAMEFLLKAQKRMKKILILQQLLLLAMRILIVLLIALLVGRFIGFGFRADENRSTAHVVILDDSPSMADGFRMDDGTTSDAFEQGKAVISWQIAKSAAEATTPQTLKVVRLTDLNAPRAFGRLNASSEGELKSYLAGYKPSPVRVSIVDGLKKAKALLAEEDGDTGKVVHVVSDFRSNDWTEDGEAIKAAVEELNAAKIKIYFVDVAHPFRKKDDRKSPLPHDNVAITELTPSKLVVARYDPLEFTLKVKNNGAAELKNLRFVVRINGDENKGRSVEMPTVPGNQERAIKFELTFDRVGSEERPLDRFSLVTVNLESAEPGGLGIDNVRHALVEVRERLPILIIEGRPEMRESKDGDGFYLRPVFSNVLGGFGWEAKNASELDKIDLSRYTFVLLLNVPSFTETAVKNLEQFAKTGGGVGFFLGPNVNSKEYNKGLYRDGAGLLPVPLMDQPSRELTDDEIQARRFRISQKKFLLRDPTKRGHPALAGLYTDERGEPVKDAEQLERVFGFISIKRYWPIVRLGKWRQDPSVTELYCMPNEQPIADFEKAIKDVADGLPVEDPGFAKYKVPLGEYRKELRRLDRDSEPLYKLGAELDALLADQRGEGNPDDALLREFWTNPRMADLKSLAVRLRDSVKFGDPFYVAKEFGRGRITMVTTTAGETWTDWPSEKPGSASYTPIIKEMGNYLSGSGAEVNRSVGDPLEVRLDGAKYKPAAGRTAITFDPATAKAGQSGPDLVPTTDLKEQPLASEGDKLVLKFNDPTTPGGYLFSFTSLKPQSSTSTETTEAPEYKGYAVNVNAVREGDLHRATRDDVTVLAPNTSLQSPADGAWLKELRNAPTDLSDWVILIVLLFALLMGEQLLASKLSYHAGASDVETHAPTAAASVRRPNVPASESSETAAAY